MRRAFWCGLMIAIVGVCRGQSTYSGYTPRLNASAAAYGEWSLAGQAANVYTFTPTTLCTVHGVSGTTYPAFSSLGAAIAPVLINDSGTPANSEIVTPSAVLTCGVTVSPAHSHTTFTLQSGTAGLQEALNALAASPVAYPSAVQLDKTWYADVLAMPGATVATPGALIAAAKGTAAAFLEDATTAPRTTYVWNGTQYAAGTWTGALAAVTAGAAAGTSPAISDAGTATVGTVQLTTGTASVGMGTAWTLTWPTTGSFQYAPACTVSGTGFSYTAATAYSAGQATLTLTATSAPAVSTVYLFSFSCK